ncbi:MAG: hypothetical protein HQ512_07930 [Rhodospirillales bacterium]|nr:hypothetical protein [Rhodospirillales bacterium]
MDEIDPEYNPFTPVYDRGYVTNNPGYWAATLPKLQEASEQCGGNDLDLSTFIGWGLIYTYQMTAAKELLHSVIEKAPDTVGADWGYFKALQELTQGPEAIEFGCENWVGKKNHGFSLLVSQSLLEIGNVEQAKDLEDEWLFMTAQGDGVAWELRGQIAEARGDWGDGSSCYALLLNNGVLFPKIQLRFLRSLSKANKETDVAGLEAGLSRILKKPLQDKVWLRYQMSRWGRCSDVKQLFAAEPKADMILPRNYDYLTIQTNRNLRLLNAKETSRHKGKLKSPVIDPKRILENIKAFKKIASELIEEGRFETFQHNIRGFRDTYSSRKNPPIFVLSSGRCGTYAFQKLMELSEGVQSHHTLLMYISGADRNHLLYRILEGRFDKAVLGEILESYLETKMAEFFYALRHDKSLVAVGHLDTVFAPFNAVFHPDSRFVYLHRDEAPTYWSFVSKKQWGGQLQHWRYDSEFPDGMFIHEADQSLSLEDNVAWYLYLTKVFSEAFLKTIPKARGVSIKSEDMFAQNPKTFAKLQKLLPISDISEEAFRENFSKPVNVKAGLIDQSQTAIDDRQKIFRKSLGLLKKDGRF